MDNRLDFIYKIEKIGVEIMQDVRQAYIKIDNTLQLLDCNELYPLSNAAKRSLELARTNLETSLQYGIKTLCLQYEKKPE